MPGPLIPRGASADEAWRLRVEFFREQCPAPHPVVVRRIDLGTAADHWGSCNLIEDGPGAPFFQVDVHRALKRPASYFVLIHEWAHAISWHEAVVEGEDHGEAFGRAYALVWRVFAEEF